MKNKARLITQEYSQIEEIDYEETFAPVARLDTFGNNMFLEDKALPNGYQKCFSKWYSK